jgi:hypothetical protein
LRVHCGMLGVAWLYLYSQPHLIDITAWHDVCTLARMADDAAECEAHIPLPGH